MIATAALSFMDELLILHAVAVIVLGLGVIAFLYALAGLIGLLDRSEDQDQ